LSFPNSGLLSDGGIIWSGWYQIIPDRTAQ
jgi:hypothetical protein